MNKIEFYILAILIFLFSNCSISDNKTVKSIDVDLTKRDRISLADIFSKVEIVSLETNDSSLMKSITKVIVSNNAFYVLDYRMSKILIFDSKGKFKYSINNKGIGPDQIFKISDFEIYDKKLYLISAVDGRLHKYDLNGQFIEKIRLPELTRAYRSLQHINKDTIAFWTYDFKNRLKYYSILKNQIIGEAMPETDDIFSQFSTPIFPFNNHIARAFDNKILKITPECGLELAYEWNFGNLNNHVKMFENPPVFDSPERTIDFVKKIHSSDVVNYMFGFNGINSKYLYTQLTRHNKQLNVLFKKNTNKSIVFEKTVEDAVIYPIFWGEDYVIGIIPEIENINIHNVIPDKILDEKNLVLKEQINEFDNPILIKYYFKKRI